MIGLSTKLQEHMALNTGGTFPEFISNVMIADDAIHAHKETKKRKVVAAPSSGAPPKYWTVYHHDPTYPPRPQHQRLQQQWAPRPPLRQHQQAAPKALPPPPPRMRLPAPSTAGAASGPLASTVVAPATSLESALHRRRLPRRAKSPLHHVVLRRWLSRRPAASTAPPWKTFLRASKSSWVHFL
jgi:hypothetical protein